MATLGSTAVAPRSGDNATLAFDVERVRHDFPVLQIHVHGKPLVYLDSGASAQQPAAVLETMDEVYRSGYRSEERRVGKECVRTCRSRRAPDHYKTKQTK